MRRLEICVMMCLLLLVSTTMTNGISNYKKSEEKPAAQEWTFLQGIITRPRHIRINGADFVEFNAFFVHYTTHWSGNIRSGFFHHFEKIFLPRFHVGWLGLHLIFARFDMALF